MCMCFCLHPTKLACTQVVATFTEKMQRAWGVIHLTARYSTGEGWYPFGEWTEADLKAFSVDKVFEVIQLSADILTGQDVKGLNQWLYDTIFRNEFYENKFDELQAVIADAEGQCCTCLGCLSAFSAVLPIRLAEPAWLFNQSCHIEGDDPVAKEAWTCTWQAAVNELHKKQGQKGYRPPDLPLAHEGLWLQQEDSEADQLLRPFVRINRPHPTRWVKYISCNI